MNIFSTPECGQSAVVIGAKIYQFPPLVLTPFWVSFWRCFGNPNGGQGRQKATSKKHQKNDAQNEPNVVSKGVPKWAKIIKKALKNSAKTYVFLRAAKNSILAFLGSKMVPKMVSKSTKNSPEIENSYFLEIVLSPTREHENQGSEPPKMRLKTLKKEARKRDGKKEGPESDFWKILVIFGDQHAAQKQQKIDLKNRAENTGQKRHWYEKPGGMRRPLGRI